MKYTLVLLENEDSGCLFAEQGMVEYYEGFTVVSHPLDIEFTRLDQQEINESKITSLEEMKQTIKAESAAKVISIEAKIQELKARPAPE